MTVTWTHPAMRSLKRHYDYRKSNSGTDAARKFRKSLFDATSRLRNFPRLGKEEKSIVYKDKEYRSLIEGVYKIIYRIEGMEIFIIEVFDTRQDQDKLIF
ncbi:MAG: type II toxin-antitoxin system RelE/ParE family toxin [Lewinellaceae bacterium]|nr:type II toxin-antitoxin system RelE/ParE family toxin [Saprospiraceae bacterium]MCB9337648.1 type II toxin-antitoxin system RelE/ParE family toxin [Lewinellaceae bacterium]